MPMRMQGGPITAAVAGFRPFSLAEYQWLVAQGFFGNERLELLDGYLVEKPVADPIHDGTLQRVNRRLSRVLPPGWEVRVQLAFTLTKSQPLPDLAVVREEADGYTVRHPGPADCGLIVEVANSSLEYDRDDKARVYARGGVPVYWVVNVVDVQVEVHERPSGPAPAPGYAVLTVYKPGDVVPFVVDGTDRGPVPVADLIR